MNGVKRIISDNIVYWIPYNRSEIICARFKLDEWHYAVFDINSDDELANALEIYQSVKGYILKKCIDDEPIAFLYTKVEDPKKNIISVHGGGWNKSIYLTHLYYRGFIKMIKHLLNTGYKVRTTCLTENKRAYRFLKAMGFVKYSSSDNLIYMWINHKRMINSPIYAYIYRA